MFNFIHPKFFELAEISGVGQIMENKKLSKMALFWKRSVEVNFKYTSVA